MTKRNRARQGVVEEVVEGEQEGGQGGGLTPLAQQAAHPLHLQQAGQGQGQHGLQGCTGGLALASLKHLPTSRLLSWFYLRADHWTRWCMAFAHCQIDRQEHSHNWKHQIQRC